MSLLTKSKDKAEKASTKAKGKGTAPAAPATQVVAAPTKAPKVVSGPPAPRANLLPPEIHENAKKRGTRRALRLAVIAVLALVIAATAGAFYLATMAATRLVDASQQTADLQVQLQSHAEVRTTIDGIALREAGVRVGGSTDIEWSDYLKELQRTLPANVELVTVMVETADVTTPYAQSDVPLEGERIATLTFTADSTELPRIPDWIDRLSGLPGFADATPGSVDLSDGVYTASVTMHINTEAYSNRFTPEAVEADE